MTFLGLLSAPRKNNSEKGTPLLSFFCKNDEFIQGFDSSSKWARFTMQNDRNKLATHVYHVLPYPDHKVVDIGTFMATPAPCQPCPKISMVMPGFDLETHFMALFKAGKKYAKPSYDVLDFVM